MNNEEKLEIMTAAVEAGAWLSPEQVDAFREGLLDGFMRIDRMQIEEERALCRSRAFPVERVQEGFAFWNFGGYDLDKSFGRAEVAAGLDGERLKLVRYIAERNGKHSLAVVYPGCFLAVSETRGLLEADQTSVYQITGFTRQEETYLARTRRVFQMEPRRSLLTEEQEDRLERLMSVANRIAITPNLYKLRDWV